LRAVVTGGPVAGLEVAWERFRARIGELPAGIRERIEIAGWVDLDRLARIESRACCGIVAERPVPERELGGNNRGLRWMAKGVPVVLTELSELGREALAASAARSYLPASPDSLAASIVSLFDDAAAAEALRRRALDWLREKRSIAATTGPLVSWARAPGYARDREDGSAARLALRHAEMLRDIAHLAGD
jgi:hypothetical protein